MEVSLAYYCNIWVNYSLGQRWTDTRVRSRVRVRTLVRVRERSHVRVRVCIRSPKKSRLCVRISALDIRGTSGGGPILLNLQIT